MKKFLLIVACLFSFTLHAAPAETGVVFLHGKEAMPGIKPYASLQQSLKDAGFRVVAPEMAWSRRRIYDADVETSMQEIDRAVTALRQEGAQRIVIVGHSMGANAAIRYAATRHVDGIVALAPGHQPEFIARQLSDDIARARQMIEQGHGQDKANFRDINVGHDLTVNTTPAIYLAWLDPAGAAVMPNNAASIKTPVPVLMVVGSKDPVTRAKDYLFDRFPAHPLSRYDTVEATHIEVPAAAAASVVDWISKL